MHMCRMAKDSQTVLLDRQLRGLSLLEQDLLFGELASQFKVRKVSVRQMFCVKC